MIKFSKETIKFADYLVYYYSNYNKLDKQYILSNYNIDDIDLFHLCSLILSDDEELAAEATSVDNPYYPHMLISLRLYLSNIADEEKKIDFTHIWSKGIYIYLETIISELLENRLSIIMEGDPSCAA